MNTFAEIKERLLIRDLISEHTEVNQRGFVLCPFHADKNPSLKINEEKNLWYCFGCNEGGDIFSFTEKLYNIPRSGALKILAERAGVYLDGTRPDPVIAAEIREARERKGRRDFFACWIDREYRDLATQYRMLQKITRKKRPDDVSEEEWLDLLAPIYARLTRAEAGMCVIDEGGLHDQFNYFLEQTA